jgi:hypothetical protein
MRMGRNRNSHWILVEMETGTTTLEDSLAISCKAKYRLTKQPNNYTTRYLPKWDEKYVCTKKCPFMFTAFLFIIAKNEKQSRCSLIDKWMSCNKSIQWSRQWRKNYQATKRSWENLKCWLLSERHHSEKANSNYMIFWKKQNHRNSGARD